MIDITLLFLTPGPENRDLHPTHFTLLRSDRQIVIDVFQGGGNQTIDMTDFDDFPSILTAANQNEITIGANLVHALDEAYQGAVLANTNGNDPSGQQWYHQSHQHAIGTENQYRDDLAQTSHLTQATYGPGPDEGTYFFDDGACEVYDFVAHTTTYHDLCPFSP